uniref:Leucine-rich repeat-containing N-terminal plant-type domain-containing protein n=1 Tax=Kalanchoe fedtschenkoi TaxID=63787 RepID=A0A7N0TV18_KALFE
MTWRRATAPKQPYYRLLAVIICSFPVAFCLTHPTDFAVLDAFRKGLNNSHLLGWPVGGSDPCGPPRWPHLACLDGRVTSIQAKDLGLKGTLPPNFNRLTELQNLGLQRNNLSGKLPTFRGLSKLQFAYLDKNQFDTIPADFFQGLTSLQTLSLDLNPLNSSGWTIPQDLKSSANLSLLRMSGCNLVGELPYFLGTLQNLTWLQLSHNRLTGALPVSLRGHKRIEVLKLNDQGSAGLNGTVDIIASMVGLKQVWLHLNRFRGAIPAGMDAVTGLTELLLYRNNFTGLVPVGLTKLEKLEILDLSFNDLSPPLPKFKPTLVLSIRGNPKFWDGSPAENASW